MKTIAIIGGSHGIGAELLRQLQKDAYEVINMSRTAPEPLDGVKHFGLNVLEDALPDIEVLDGLVYCPGSVNLKPFRALSLDTFREDYELNVVGAIRTLQHFEKALKRSDKASVVLFSTVACKIGMPFHASVSASKSAVEGLTKSLAAEYINRIRFNAIAPTLTETPLTQGLLHSEKQQTMLAERHPMKRYLQPGEVAQLASYLLSDRSSAISGQVFCIDAGIASVRS